MHQGRPYGLHVIGQALTSKDSAFIDNAAKKLTNQKELSGLDGLKLVYDLPDGGTVLIIDMGGNFRVIAHKPIPEEKPLETDGLAKDYIPMLFSSAVTDFGYVQPDHGLLMTLTHETCRRLKDYSDTELAPRNVELQRFACKYGFKFQEFLPRIQAPNITYTQYIKQRPTWYSGAMASVIQIVGGYGKQDLDKLPDEPLERVKMLLPKDVYDAAIPEITNQRLPAYMGLPHRDGEFQYSYKFLETDLISFSKDKEPWLVKVNSRGVWVMPLPIIPITTTRAFRDYMTEVNDFEILAILDKFGGMPSGEAMPERGFEAWRRAGVIQKVCDTSDFYQGSGYSTAMGWSANTRGTEAVNTCNYFDEGAGLFIGMAYKIRLNLGSAINKGWVKPLPPLVNVDYRAAQSYLARLLALLQKNDDKNRAIRYKIARTSFIDIQARAMIVGDRVNEVEVEHWDNMELPPIAQHQVSMTQISKGYIAASREIKVPEPFLDGCVSIATEPLAGMTSNLDRIDTIMLAYYIQDSLKVVRNFRDVRPQEVVTQGNFEKYMYVGTWEETSYSGDGTIQGELYLTDVDDRRVVAPIETYKRIVGKDLGFSGALYEQSFRFWMAGTTWRVRFYTHKTTTYQTAGQYLRQAVMIPFFCRNTLIYAMTDGQGIRTDTEVYELKQQRDPNSYESWTDGPGGYFDNAPIKTGRPWPIDRDPIWAETHTYSSGEGNFFADDGNWLPSLPFNVKPLLLQYGNGSELSSPIPPHIGAYNTRTDTQPSEKYKLMVSVTEDMKELKTSEHDDRYYKVSPNVSGTFFYHDACKVMFGESKYANISETDARGLRKTWGETRLVGNSRAWHFTGVINE